MRMLTFARKRLPSALGVSLLGVALTAQASGFRLPEDSIAGMGYTNAIVANPDETGAYAYNPAALGLHQRDSLSVGLIAIDPNLKKDNTKSNPSTPFYVPNLFYAYHVKNTPWALGLNIDSPFGLETKWPAPGTFPLLDPFGTSPTRSRLEMINYNPNVVYRVGPDTSLAVGADYYDLRKANLDSSGSTLQGKGSEWGWNVALLHRMGPWSFGASYRSRVNVDVNGSVGFPLGNPTLGLPAGSTLPAKTRMDFPAMLQVGARYRFNPQWAAEFDIERTYWSSFNQLQIQAQVPGAGWTTLRTDQNQWKNSNAYRFGVSYKPDTVNTWRFGYTFDQTPQPDATFSARVPDADRNLFAVGYGRALGQGWSLDLAYMYVNFQNRTINQTAIPNVGPGYNGTYKSSVNLFGVGITKTF